MLHEIFERTAQRWPEHVAVEIPPGDGRPARTFVTYAELARAANALAQRLRPFADRECVVGVLLPRTNPQLFVAQLAILEAGAAHACLDPSFPDERVREILGDAQPVVLLTDRDGMARLPRCGWEGLAAIDVGAALVPVADSASEKAALKWSGSREVFARPGGTLTRSATVTVEARAFSTPAQPNGGAAATRPAPRLSPERLAYVIYTSGTSGRPKGVMVEHRSISNLVATDVETFRLTPSDRVGQSSSAAYDSSIEETWLAFAAGAALVVMDDETVRLGPDLIGWLRRERITVLCPPPTLLRATGCRDPESALPGLKLLYVGGEPLPCDIADGWSRGRLLVNGYGPTECTVTCLRDVVSAGEPVTVGRPVRGVTAWVLNEELAEVAGGERGELCIGGIGLARGYWQRPELTAEKFIAHPRLGRIYRTGDLVHCDATGRFSYHGRIDSQVKVRGYRIELGEIEARLVASPGVRAAACYVHDANGHAVLAAVVVPEDHGRPPSTDDLRSALGRVLPDYMVPGRIGLLSELPTTVGGKLDRAALSRLHLFEPPPPATPETPRNSIEAKIQAAFSKILRGPPNVSLQADFFVDLGGDSLSAAQLVTALRDDPATAWATVRDIYEARTVAAVAARAPETALPSTPPPLDPIPASTANRRALTGLFQLAWLAASLATVSVLAYVAAFRVLPWVTATMGVTLLIAVTPPLCLTGIAPWTAIAVRLAAWTKRRLVGRYEPWRGPVWGEFYRRNWVVLQTAKLIPWRLIEGTEFQNAALRALGARIGERVHLGRGVDLLRGGWDLLEIGDDVSVGRDAGLELVHYEEGQIVFDRISLGNGSTLETHAYVGAGGAIGQNGFLTARSSLARGACLPADERWDGIPARPAGTPPAPPPLPAGERAPSPRLHGTCLVMARLILAAALLLPLELLAIGFARIFGVDADAAATWLSHPAITLRILGECAVLAGLSLPMLLATEALACRAMGPVRAGIVGCWSPSYLRASLKTGLVESAGRWLYGTLFWPAWLRLAGMKVGAGCEISSLIDTVPELVEIGAQSFCADGIYLAGPLIHRGTVTLQPVRLGRNNFVGNGAVIPGGTRFPDNVLLGICTVADQSFLRPDTSWFGHPPFELSRRATTGFDRRLTHDPTPIRYVVRVSWEVLRFALPVPYALIIPAWFAIVAAAMPALPPAVFLLVALPLLSMAAVASLTVLAIGIKWILLGRVRPGMHPLWSAWASRWDFFCLAWTIYAGEAATMFDGTVALVWLVQAIGVRVGRDVVLGNGFADCIPDPDLLTLEDGATVDCHFQAHTFEDRVLKNDHVVIRRHATVSRNAVLLYGAVIGAAARVAPNSVVMKHEHLLAGRSYAGAPV